MRNKGFALVAALVAVVLLGALIVGAFVATTEETRISGNVTMGTRAMSAAESVLENDLTGWAAGQVDSLGIAQRAVHSTAVPGFAVTTTLVRLDSSLYWVIADAADGITEPGGTNSVRRRISLLVRRTADSTGQAVLLRLEERPWSELF